MAIGAGQGTSVFSRIIGRHVLENMRHPEVGGMAVIAIPVGHEMAVVLAGCCYTVMTGRTRSGHGAVVKARGHPGHGGMTQIAFTVCRNVIVTLTSSSAAVVAGRASARVHAGVIEHCR